MIPKRKKPIFEGLTAIGVPLWILPAQSARCARLLASEAGQQACATIFFSGSRVPRTRRRHAEEAYVDAYVLLFMFYEGRLWLYREQRLLLIFMRL